HLLPSRLCPCLTLSLHHFNTLVLRRLLLVCDLSTKAEVPRGAQTAACIRIYLPSAYISTVEGQRNPKKITEAGESAALAHAELCREDYVFIRLPQHLPAPARLRTYTATTGRSPPPQASSGNWPNCGPDDSLRSRQKDGLVDDGVWLIPARSSLPRWVYARLHRRPPLTPWRERKDPEDIAG
ncbi:hypothetical protein C8R44DRAFT_860390, partial [Mycena epipterygia]